MQKEKKKRKRKSWQKIITYIINLFFQIQKIEKWTFFNEIEI